MVEEQPEIVAKGFNGQLELYENKVRIRRKGILAVIFQGLKGDKDIFLDQISSVQFKRSGLMKGYIQFAFLGGQEAKGGVWQADTDENTVTFMNNKEFENFKNILESRLHKLRSIRGRSESDLDELEKLAELKSKGIVTDEEFIKKKQQLLGF